MGKSQQRLLPGHMPGSVVQREAHTPIPVQLTVSPSFVGRHGCME
jgi:hypothetical protein